ncbi:xanthine dehydrogenase 1-like [Mycetomoellerius zeteki]|uniref:xanthine dehydrogenase 1-like n=1 Tax=Mycetomoellerius zeteki TaxID=64791 RepID=UPI00084E809A|nr:PREDICTED: xanthine dehydrogenase 1-like [Trachymyrmex zeteki]
MEMASVSSNVIVQFTINGILYTVSDDSLLIRTSLLSYIREYVGLRGTKAMCHEGGCGACIVSVRFQDKVIAVNSCLVPVLICQGWNIFTIESLGNHEEGYHSIQAMLADKNGSQCGYCSPGMVMNMYSLILKSSHISMEQIENSFGGNICRCTGYRAILDAFKGFAIDAPPSMVKNIHEIEELHKIKPCRKYGMPCVRSCYDKQPSDEKRMLSVKLKDGHFYRTFSIENLFLILKANPLGTYTLNGGNTANGVYRSSIKDMYIDINNIQELRNIEKTDSTLVLGGSVTLTTAIETFQKYSNDAGFKYLNQLAQHAEMIANITVRNIGTIAGNLMIKYQHNEFPSDLFLMLETVGAQVHVLESPSQKQSLYLWEFLNLDMHHKIIYSVVLPKLTDEYIYRSYKIMPRAQNAKAHVNAGFLFKLDSDGKVLELPNIIFGGINKSFKHARSTEEVLLDKSIIKNLSSTLKEALNTLHNELQPDYVLPDYSPKFRKTLAEGLFYRCMLSIKPENIRDFYRSGGTSLERGLNSGKQDYDTKLDEWPLTEPIQKLESLEQTSGECQFCDDLGPFPREVFCAFVVTNVGNGQIRKIDASEALKKKDVVAFFSAQDIPGKNLCISAASKLTSLSEDELLFAEKDILYAGQPVGVIVAKTHNLANEAAKLVKITYSESVKRPVISIEDAFKTTDKNRIRESVNIPAKRKGTSQYVVVTGFFHCGSQYHYTLETQSCVCVPVVGGMNVYPSSQWMDLIQVSIANCLNVQNSSINVLVKRLGGSYGSKISRNAQISCACALVCHKLNRPARFVMSMENNMQSIGKRYSSRQEYAVWVNLDGVIQYLKTNQWSNCGSSFNEPHSEMIASYMQSCYLTDTWELHGYDVRTDLPSNTFCRASGSTEGIAMIENIMEHIATEINKDPLAVRLANMNDVDKSVLEPMIKDLSNRTNYEERKHSIDQYNTHNRWKKKGIAVLPMKYLVMYEEGQYETSVSVCARDGSVCVTHSGIEIDQGINTKIAQIAAHTLDIRIEMISVKQSNNLSAPNKSTGHSITTETCGYTTIQACRDILNKLVPIRKKIKDPKWSDLIFKAYEENVDLSSRYTLVTGPTKEVMKPYPIYGVTIAEVEIDVLTGQHIVRRVDLMIDAGQSLNPKIDIGQVEGAFVMGMGYWTSEDLMYDPKTGVLTNDRTWNYKPPGAKDIPEDFRVYLCKNSFNANGIHGSKTIDEAPLCMSYVIPMAIRRALSSVRKDLVTEEDWYKLDGPCTTERILLTSLTSIDGMII